MIKTFWAFGLVLVLLAGLVGPSKAGSPGDHQVLVHCAALFDAREKWLSVMADALPEQASMATRRDLLLQAAAPLQPKGQQLRSGARRPSFQERSLRILTRFAQQGRVSSCPEDALCQACSELFSLTK